MRSIPLRRLLPRLIMLALIAALAASSVALAAPKRVQKRSHQINATVKAASVDTQGSATILAGTISDNTLGNGAVVYRLTGTTTQSFTFTVFGVQGTLKGTGSATVAVQPDGSVSIAGSLKVTGGTGRYKGAKGTATITGSATTAVVSAQITGTLKY